MNKEQQRIKIAEACGWADIRFAYLGGTGLGPLDGLRDDLPDYLNDLNAMHEAEKVLPRQLSHIDYWQKGYGRFQTLLAEYTITPYSATAAQRAEAFLKTLNLWTYE
jgi:hypothetical protein